MPGRRMRSEVIVEATVAVNAVLFVGLFTVGEISGSRAVLSQAIYVAADLIGALLLTWGIIASQRPPDDRHPFGRGKERFFWSFSASLVTFTVAGLLVILTALDALERPGEVTDLRVAILILAATVLSSLVTLYVTLRELRHANTSISTFLESSNLGLKIIFYQDIASVCGALVALSGVGLIALTHDSIYDGIASMGVGILFLITGVLIAGESRELLVGKAVPPDDARRILATVERDARVRRVRSVQSMMLGPEDLLVALRVNFQDGLTTDQIEGAIDQISAALRETFPTLRHLLIEPES